MQYEVAYSIPRSAQKKGYQQTPGVGQYEINQKIKAKGAIMPSYKDNYQQDSNPGVGLYNVEVPRHAKHGIIPRSKSNLNQPKSYTPGIGYYNIQRKELDRGHTFKNSGQKNDDNKVFNIGPGHYDKEYSSISNKRPIIGVSKRFVEKPKSSIGPGHYEKPYSSFTKKGGVIPNASRLGLDKQQLRSNPNIGPGSYKTQLNYKQKGAIIPTYQRTVTKTNNPGIGQYSLNQSTLDKKGGIIPTSGLRKFDKHEKTGPGVGDYDCYHVRPGHGAIIPSAQHHKINQFKITPGPTDYETMQRTKSRGAIMPKANIIGDQKSLNEITPGVGQYKYEKSYLSHQGGVIPRHPKSSKIDTIPGPSDYINEEKRKVNQWTFKKAQDNKDKGVTPGPGDYNYDNKYNQFTHKKPLELYI